MVKIIINNTAIIDAIKDEDKGRRQRDRDLSVGEKYGVKKGTFNLLERQEMDKILKNSKVINGVTIRQLVRVTGVSKYMVERT